MKPLENKRKAMEARSCDDHVMIVQWNVRNLLNINDNVPLGKVKESKEENTPSISSSASSAAEELLKLTFRHPKTNVSTFGGKRFDVSGKTPRRFYKNNGAFLGKGHFFPGNRPLRREVIKFDTSSRCADVATFFCVFERNLKYLMKFDIEFMIIKLLRRTHVRIGNG